MEYAKWKGGSSRLCEELESWPKGCEIRCMNPGAKLCDIRMRGNRERVQRVGSRDKCSNCWVFGRNGSVALLVLLVQAPGATGRIKHRHRIKQSAGRETLKRRQLIGREEAG